MYIMEIVVSDRRGSERNWMTNYLYYGDNLKITCKHIQNDSREKKE